jgi:hypothetical protein
MTGADRPHESPVAAPSRPRTLGLAVCAAAILTGLISSWPSLGYYWNMDDLHLVRPYSAGEIAGTFGGHWDPDGIETIGFRPLTTAFNHARAVVFGESLVAHRLFLLGLYAAALALMAGLIARLGAPAPAVLIGAVFAIVAKNSYYHYVWVADGVHVLQLVLCVLAMRAAFRYVDDGRRRALAASVAWFGAAMLTREDSLAVLPAMLGVGLGLQVIWSGQPAAVTAARRRRLRTGGVAMAVVLPAWWLWRLASVPDAPNVKLELAAFDRVLDMVVWTISLAGGVDPLWPAYVALALAAVAATRLLPPVERRLAWVLLASALVACAIGNVRARANLLILPALFYGGFLGVVFAGVARAVPRARTAVVVVAVLAAAGAIRASRLEQIDLHPMSAGQIGRDWMFISGRLGDATIPEVRRRVLEPKLAAFDLLDPDIDIVVWQQSVREKGRAGPRADGGIFVAPRAFLEGR